MKEISFQFMPSTVKRYLQKNQHVITETLADKENILKSPLKNITTLEILVRRKFEPIIF
jgi:hypothetical protein